MQLNKFIFFVMIKYSLLYKDIHNMSYNELSKIFV